MGSGSEKRGKSVYGIRHVTEREGSGIFAEMCIEKIGKPIGTCRAAFRTWRELSVKNEPGDCDAGSGLADIP